MRKIYNSVAKDYEIYLQEERTPISSGIYDLHEKLIYYILIIIGIVIISIIYIIYRNNKIISNKYIRHSIIIEIIWTIIPGIILIIIALPSFKLLYSIDEIINPLITVKAIGNQWYWTYEINDINGKNIEFDSYAIEEESLIEKGYGLRLLDVDNILYLPTLIPIRILTTAVDVMHSFAIPSLGIKIDAIPGRINHGLIYLLKEGRIYGQCSELCGSSHYNMPICIEGISPNNYIKWLLSL